MGKIKLLYLTPHLSTGGQPQFVLKRIQELQKFKDQIELFLVEYSQFSDTYIVQRNEIIKLLGESHFFSLGGTTETKRKYQLINIIKNNNIDIVHSEEMLEGFEGFNRIPLDLINQIYSNDRTWRMVETCHNVWFDPINLKKVHPEAYALVTPFHKESTFLSVPSYTKTITYPYENKVKDILEKNEIYGEFNQVPLIKKIQVRQELGLDMFKTHVLNVGLWTEGKNQKEGVLVAEELSNRDDIEFHFIGNQAPNFESYWGPIMKNLPKNVRVWGERDDVDKFMQACDVLMFNSTWECNPLVVREAINYGMKILTRDLTQYVGMFDGIITPITEEPLKDQLLKLIESKDSYKIPEDPISFGEQHLEFYKKVMGLDIKKQDTIKNNYVITQHYVCQPFLDIKGETNNKFEIKMYDGQDKLIYENLLPTNSWVKLNQQYYTDWKTKIWENGELIYENKINLEGKRVYISFGSKSLGDTMAWAPYLEEFRKKHNCYLMASTFMNYLFVDQYPEIEFVEPGDVVPNIHAQYRVGWFYNEDGTVDYNMTHSDYKKQPLQKTATDILGLEYIEIRPKLNLPKIEKKKKGKVGIGLHSTAQAKYWNNPTGWQEVVNHLNGLGYECVIYSREDDGYMGNIHPKGIKKFKGGNLQEVIDDLSECEFFIGLGSGLSWLAWACKLPVVLISGFSEKWAETTLDTYRVINESVCHGCFNSERLDAGDWNWCPLHKNTDRMFECTKEINSDMVIKEINKIINNEVMEEKIDEVSFDWGKKSEWYVDAAIKEIFEDDTYERFFKVEEGDVVVDLGASLGPFTYKILPKDPKQCYVVEPLSYQIDVLHKNVGRDNVKIIQGAITDKKKIDVTWDDVSESVPTFTFKEFLDENNITHIDFLKCDCEGGEYDVFQQSNIEFLKTIPKIVTEFHMRDDDSFHKCKFRWFRDNIFPQFDNIQVFSVDGVDIKWDLWNEHFIEYYCEVIVYMDNRK
jgi:autotransporter strand-loop-strand O-heptosyltransferase